MKICYVVSGDLWGGAEEQAFSLIKEIVENTDHSVDVITFNDGLFARRVQQIGVDVQVIDEKANNAFMLFRKIFFSLKGRSVDILHAHGLKEHLLAGLAGRAASVHRIVRTFHGRGMLSSSLKKNIDKFCSSFLADTLIAVSSELASHLVSRGFSDKKIKIIRNGINVDSLKENIHALPRDKQHFADETTFIFGVVGRLVPVKGHRYLFAAFKRLLENDCIVRLLVLGNGPLEQEYRNAVRDMGITEQVCFLGFVDNPLDYVVDFDAFVMPSLNEGIPLALLEAMGLGVPVIASRVGGIPEVVNDGSTGLLVEPQSVDGLYNACLRLFRDADLRKGLATRAEKHIKDDFSAGKTVQETLALYCS